MKAFREQKGVMNFLLPYAIFILIPLFFIIGISYSYTITTQKQIISSANTSSKCLIDEMTNTFNSIYSIHSSISEEISATDNQDENPKKYFTDYGYTELHNSIKSYADILSYVDMIYIGFSDDTIMSSSTINSSKFFFENYFSKSNYNFDLWEKVTFSATNKNMIMPIYRDGNIYIKYTLPVINEGSSNVSNVTVNYLINFSKLFKSVFSSFQKDNINVYILNSKGESVYSFVSLKDKNKSFDPSKLLSSSNIYTNYETINAPFETAFDNYSIICLYNKTNLHKKLDRIYILSIILIILSIISSLYLLLYITKKNYQPILSLSNLLGISYVTEFTIIENSIRELLSHHASLSDTVNTQKSKLQESLIKNVILGNFSQEMKQLLNNYGLVFSHDFFYVMLISVSNKNIDEIKINKSSKPSDIFKSFFDNSILNNEQSKCYLIHFKDEYVCIINTCSDMSNVLNKLAGDLLSLFEKQFNIYLGISISDIHKGFSSISLAYFEALDAEQLLNNSNSSKIVSFSEMKSMDKYYISISEETSFVHAIKNGNSDVALSIVNNWFEHTICIANTSFIKHYIICIISKLPYSIKISVDSDLAKHLSYSYLSSIQNDSFKLKKSIQDTVIRLCECFSQADNTQELIQKLCDYIDDNYSNPELTVQSISLYFHYSESYINATFKKYRYTTCSLYITDKRLAVATDLLKNTNTEIKTILELSGFSNSRTFNRIFKRELGITPSEYRHNNQL